MLHDAETSSSDPLLLVPYFVEAPQLKLYPAESLYPSTYGKLAFAVSPNAVWQPDNNHPMSSVFLFSDEVFVSFEQPAVASAINKEVAI